MPGRCGYRLRSLHSRRGLSSTSQHFTGLWSTASDRRSSKSSRNDPFRFPVHRGPKGDRRAALKNRVRAHSRGRFDASYGTGREGAQLGAHLGGWARERVPLRVVAGQLPLPALPQPPDLRAGELHRRHPARHRPPEGNAFPRGRPRGHLGPRRHGLLLFRRLALRAPLSARGARGGGALADTPVHPVGRGTERPHPYLQLRRDQGFRRGAARLDRGAHGVRARAHPGHADRPPSRPRPSLRCESGAPRGPRGVRRGGAFRQLRRLRTPGRLRQRHRGHEGRPGRLCPGPHPHPPCLCIPTCPASTGHRAC